MIRLVAASTWRSRGGGRNRALWSEVCTAESACTPQLRVAMLSPLLSPVKKFLHLLLGSTVLAVLAHADVRLPAIISDHMVLQSAQPVAIWGWADPTENVSVQIAGQTKSTTTGPDGRWRVTLDPLARSTEPVTLTASGKNTVTVSDVLVGEVWLCSGQSNAAMQMKGLHGAVDNADAEIAAANFPTIRQFIHDEVYNIYELPVPPTTPQQDRAGRWIVCSPDTAAKFTAIGYYFARELQQTLGTSVGIINSAVGGTPIEAWTTVEAQSRNATLKPVLDYWSKFLVGYDPAAAYAAAETAKQAWLKERAEAQAAGLPIPKAPAASRFRNYGVSNPGGLFNGMIAPLIPYTMRGVIWYQGERNAAGALTQLYGEQLTTFIRDWRAQWGDDFYFAVVQLPNYQKVQTLPIEANGWGVYVRDGQRLALSEPHTGLAITIDIGGVAAGHPTNKLDYGHRVALLALHDVYGQNIPVWSGPIVKTARRRNHEVLVTFDHNTGLKTKDGGELKGFAVAGEDKNFVWAQARIEQDAVIVSSDQVATPVAVRYNWATNPVGNLVNAADLPASPFRTDACPPTTRPAR